VKTLLNNRRTSGRIAIPLLNLYYGEIVIRNCMVKKKRKEKKKKKKETVWYWYRDRQIDPWNRI
jgi:ABC-type oligopeptide transport system ATPase subunit